MKLSAVKDQRVTQDDGEDPEHEGDQVPQEDPGQRDPLENIDQSVHKEKWT